MKTLTRLVENYEKNPGNSLSRGVTNHLTPLGNIVTNIRNIFGTMLGIIVEPGEDGVSLKLHSSRFISKEELEKILNTEVLGSSTLSGYIKQQGLTDTKFLNLGTYWVAYFGPNDIRTKEKVDTQAKTTDCTLPTACTEMKSFDIEECELNKVFEDNIDDEELEDKTKEQLLEFINGKDKVKSATKLAELLADDLELPEDYYFKGVRDVDGNESIALRYRYTKRRPFGKEVELSKSLLNIYRSGDQAVWVEAFLTRDKNSSEMNNIIETVLKLIGATPTDDPCVYAITPGEIENLKDEVGKQKSDDDEDKNEISDTLKDSEEKLNA